MAIGFRSGTRFPFHQFLFLLNECWIQLLPGSWFFIACRMLVSFVLEPQKSLCEKATITVPAKDEEAVYCDNGLDFLAVRKA